MTIEELEYLSQRVADKLSYLQKPILSLNEACKFCNMERSTMYKLTSSRKIPFYRHSKFIYFRRVELEAWLTSIRIKPAGEVGAELDTYLDGKELLCHV